MKKTVRVLSLLLALFAAFAMTGVAFVALALPQQYSVPAGETPALPYGARLSAGLIPASGGASSARYEAQLSWLGLFPVGTVAVQTVEPTYVIPGGIPFGIKLYTDGVLIVGMSDVDTAGGTYNPARSAGLKTGDRILSVNGSRIASMQELSALVENSGGRALTLRVQRDGVDFDVRFAPALSLSEQVYKAGLWVRDSSAGIGTLTFYDPETMRFAGLGHAICDADTGQIMPIASGEAVPARIFDVRPGRSGTPGELRGGFEAGRLGSLLINGSTGLYGVLEQKPLYHTPLPVAMRQQVHAGAAQMLTTVEGNVPRAYDVEIEKVRYNDPSGRHMVVRVTDPELLALTGGIVQGMSGSPLIQDGRLIGAVTHVFVNDPQRGYAIFAETMLETAQSVASENKLKNVS